MDSREKEQIEQWQGCGCGGKFRMVIESCGVEHTYPTCKPYDDMDLDALLKTRGHLALYLHGMKASSAKA